ncbi:MAG: nicotinate-nucleotide adenylyltransferase [Nitrosomonas sp.]|nr:nicotinate-nucleotide adenylyltransferase [Nitrosomonas sp.]
MSNTGGALRLIGIYGGTFDPVHYGHLRIAEEAAEDLQLGHLYFLPAGQPRLRTLPLATTRHRRAMLRRAIQGNARFLLDDRELRQHGETRSVESLRDIRRDFEEKGTVALCFIVGADAFLKLPQWYCWQELLELCHIVIVNRPGHVLIKDVADFPPDLKRVCEGRWTDEPDDLRELLSGRIYVAQTSLLAISSTGIRAAIQSGKSVRYLLPDSIINYIIRHNIYAGEK